MFPSNAVACGLVSVSLVEMSSCGTSNCKTFPPGNVTDNVPMMGVAVLES